jgi:hypothetical protein
MKQILNTIKIISIFFIALGFLNCEEEQVYFPQAFAEFTYTINNETGVVKFINTSRNATIFTWTFGDGQTSTETNPSHIYQPGTYTVSLVSKNIAGSFRTFQDVIIVGEKDDNGGGVPSDCIAEDSENIDPANGDLNWTFKTNDTAHTIEAFGNTSASIVDNPVVDDVNSSCNVEEFVKASGCETWSGLGTELATALDFTAASTNKVFKMKVLAKNQVADVTLRLERLPYPDTDPAVERVASVTEVGAWQELTFDFSDVTSGTYKSLILYFERNASCDGDLYYFDDLKQIEGDTGGGGVCTTDDAQSLSAANFNMTMATDPSASIISDGAGFDWIDNPDFDNAVNSSCKVGKITKSGQFDWDNNQIDLDAKLDFDANTGLKIKVWSARANTEVRIKLEEIGNAGNNVEKFLTTSVTSGWEELTFPFSSADSGKFNKIVIFFDLNAKNTDTYYFDDFKLYTSTGGGGTCPDPPAGELLANGDFEAGESCWQFFAGTSISTTVNNGGSNSAEMQGATGVAVNFKQERFAIGVVQPNTSYTVSFDIIADGPFGDGGVFKAFAFSEGADGGSVPATLHTLTDSTTSLATTWETKTYTFTTAANANQVEGGISFLLEIVNSSAKLNVDNVVIKKTP